MIHFLATVAVCVAIVVIGQSPTSFLKGAAYDSFAASMTGPGQGCEGWFYRVWDCSQIPGRPPTCHEETIYTWTCKFHPKRIGKYDFDDDLDVDLADFAVL